MISNEFGPWPSVIIKNRSWYQHTVYELYLCTDVCNRIFCFLPLFCVSGSVVRQLSCSFSKGKGEEKAEKKKRREMTVQGFRNQVWKNFFFLLFLAFQEFGIFMGHYCRSPPFNFICRKHTLFASGLQKLKARPCDHDLAAEGAKLCEANGIQHLWKPYTINNKTRLWK